MQWKKRDVRDHFHFHSDKKSYVPVKMTLMMMTMMMMMMVMMMMMMMIDDDDDDDDDGDDSNDLFQVRNCLHQGGYTGWWFQPL